MGGERETSMDILPVGMADDFSEFLGEVMAKTAELVNQADSLARKLDGKDDNTENNTLKDMITAMAKSANEIVRVVKEAAEDGIQKLEDKDRFVGSDYQKRCISQIQGAKDAMSAHDYQECRLESEKPQTFTSAQKQEFWALLEETNDKWYECNEKLCTDAENLAASRDREANELSDVCFKIADQIGDIYDKLGDIINAAGFHLEHVDREREANTEAINQAAEANMESVKQEAISALNNIVSGFAI